MKRKVLRLTILAAVIASLCLSALALTNAGSDTLAMFDAAEALFFDTTNVTLAAEAKFTYDGEWFKTFHGSYRQDGENSALKVAMDTPRADGTVYSGGYTVVGNGADVYYSDTYFGDYFSETIGLVENTVLQRGNLVNAALSMIRAALPLLGDRVASKIGENQYALKVDNVPDAVNGIVNYVLQRNIDWRYYLDAYRPKCQYEYVDWQATFAHEYKLYARSDMPEDFFDELYNGDGEGWGIYYAVCDRMYMYYQGLTNQYEGGYLVVLPDGGTKWVATRTEMVKLTDSRYVDYADYSLAVQAYYFKLTGEELTEDMLVSIYNSNNDELWQAYTDMTAEMEASYAAQMEADKDAVGALVNADGSLTLLYTLPEETNGSFYMNMLAGIETVGVRSADFQINTDDQGRLTFGSGTMSLTVTDKTGKEHILTVNVTGTATDYGTTKVGAFDPADYDLVTFNEYWENLGSDYEPQDDEYVYEEPTLLTKVNFLGREYETLIAQ